MGIDDVFAVIAEGTRRQILENLRDGDRAVGELVIELQVSQPTVSKHLKVLREAGLVSMRAQGQKRYYSLDTAPLGLVLGWLGWGALAIGLWVGFLAFALPALAVIVVRRDRTLMKKSFPFGPFMVVGALVGLVWGTALAGRIWG